MKPRNITLHRAVALAFVPNPEALPEVAHRDGNPGHNHARNLRWSSHVDNQMDMRIHGTMQDGEKCISAKITVSQVKVIRARAKKRGEGIKLAKEFGLSRGQISDIKNGKAWRWLS